MKNINLRWFQPPVQGQAKYQPLLSLTRLVFLLIVGLAAGPRVHAQQHDDRSHDERSEVKRLLHEAFSDLDEHQDDQDQQQVHELILRNPSGASQTISATGTIDFTNPFFASLGTNGRSCATCHEPMDGWSVSARNVRKRFLRSDGQDPIFRLSDGANCPNADVSTREEQLEAYSLLLRKGLIRIARPVPPVAQFTLVAIDDPYKCSTPTLISVHRRPLPATNLKFITTVMWDGRETVSFNFPANLLRQAGHAVSDHFEPATAPAPATLQQIRDFELALSTAQISDKRAHSLLADGAQGGAENLSQQKFFLGINDGLGSLLAPPGVHFDNRAFNVFASWFLSNGDGDEGESVIRNRQAIARGEDLFNTTVFEFTGVPGFKPAFRGFCTTCHDTPNVGNTSVPGLFNIGTADASRRTPDLPLFTFKDKKTGTIIQTTDPGAALFDGRSNDIGAFKAPVLRGLAARAPYFHDGSAANLLDVVNFYDERFKLGLTREQKSDLVEFLRSL